MSQFNGESALQRRYLDDFKNGDVFRSHGRTVTETDIVMYTSMAGLKVPIFTNADFARKHTSNGGIIAPGLLTATIATGLLEEILGPYLIAALELGNFKFKVPVKPGDTLYASVTMEDKRNTSDGKRAIFYGRVRVRNHLDQEVMEFSEVLLMHRTPPSDR